MKESIGNAVLFNIVIIFVVILIAFFVGSLSYSKAFKVKNKIIEELEKEGEYASDPENAYTKAEDEILKWLKSGNDGTGIGYRRNTAGGANNTGNCKSNNENAELVNNVSDYEYCVYKISTCTGKTASETSQKKAKCGIYYEVVAYMYFDVPIIEDLIKIPVRGETLTFNKIES